MVLIKLFQDIGSPSGSRVRNNVYGRRQLILHLPTLGCLLFALKHLLLTVGRNRVKYIDFKIQDASFISLPPAVLRRMLCHLFWSFEVRDGSVCWKAE